MNEQLVGTVLDYGLLGIVTVALGWLAWRQYGRAESQAASNASALETCRDERSKARERVARLEALIVAAGIDLPKE